MSATDDEPPKLESSDQPVASEQRRIEELTAEVTSQVITRVSKFFSGPLPPPVVLADYNQAFPGAAERIVVMAESQLKHRQTIEAKVVDSNCRNETAGLIIGGAIAVLSLIIGGYLMAHDKSAQGFVVILTAATSLAGTFLYNRYAQAKERAEKMKPFQQAVGLNLKRPDRTARD